MKLEWAEVLQRFEELRGSEESSATALETTVKLVLEGQSDAPESIQSLLAQQQSTGSSRFNSNHLTQAVHSCSSADVNPPPGWMKRFQKWTANPAVFWTMSEDVPPNQKRKCPINVVFNRLQACKEEQPVVRRLCVLALYHLSRHIATATAAQDRYKAESLQDLASRRVCEERIACPSEQRAVKARIKEYFKAAAVYRRVIEQSDLGILLLIPNKIPPYLWERYLPRKHEVVEEIITYLKSRKDRHRDYRSIAQPLIDQIFRWITDLHDANTQPEWSHMPTPVESESRKGSFATEVGESSRSSDTVSIKPRQSSQDQSNQYSSWQASTSGKMTEAATTEHQSPPTTTTGLESFGNPIISDPPQFYTFPDMPDDSSQLINRSALNMPDFAATSWTEATPNWTELNRWHGLLDPSISTPFSQAAITPSQFVAADVNATYPPQHQQSSSHLPRSDDAYNGIF